MNSSSELELIKRALFGDEDAHRRILGLYKGRVFSYIYRIIGNYDDAEELALDTFVRCFRSLHSFEMSKSFSTWLFAIAHNLTVDFLRKKKMEYEYLDEKYKSDEDFVKEYERKEQLESIDTALMELAPLDREIMILFYKEDKPYKEISDITKIPVTTIKTRLHRARLKLRDIVHKKSETF